MIAAAFGLAAIVATSQEAFVWIKWAGVAYLAWIGLQLVLTSEEGTAPPESAAASPGKLFRQGFITSMANPFAVVFFGALFPQFIDPAVAIWPQLLILGATYLVVDGLILLLWGWLGVRAAEALKRFGSGLVNKVCGGLMILAAGLLASRDMAPER
jgi:threonine/homoserine/homoserine lactone efflux protein